ncbi:MULTISPECIES: HEAT repeat domain-containing protein [unclassified Mycolicibacterium]|uniref:HEAT repeat domain-containing protein n=1 Tax=unclassified Mycolicibacterium TaxID=2636767 RepID=UPI002EDAD247
MSDYDEVLARLRRGIADIESTGPVDKDAAAAARKARKARKEKPKSPPDPQPYLGMPEGDDWMDNLPAWLRDGENGFDRRLMADLAAVGYRCYTINRLPGRTVPKAMPIVLDWLEHLEERIPGAETRHRELIRGGLVWRLYDPAARGNQRAIDLVITQIRRQQPPLPSPFSDGAGQVLARIALPRHFDQICELFHELHDDNSAKFFLTEYFGKVKTTQSRDIVLPYLDRWPSIVIPTLIKMKATGVRHLIEPHLKDSWPPTRKYARRAMERLT